MEKTKTRQMILRNGGGEGEGEGGEEDVVAEVGDRTDVQYVVGMYTTTSE